MGRPRGSPNKLTASVRAVVARLEKGGRISLERCFSVLQQIADDPGAPAVARIAACRAIFDRAFGLPRAHVDVEHGISRDAVSLLVEIATSDRHRAALESLERERNQRRLTARTAIEIEKEAG